MTDSDVDPELLPVVLSWRDRMRSRPPPGSISIEQMRERAIAEFAEANAEPTPLASVQDLTADTSVRRVPLRLYDPRPGCDTGILVYLHGGGWMVGNLDFEDAALRYLAARSGQRIVSVDYRLIPEHPFPAAIDDAVAVVRWLNDGIGISVDPARIALGGASAGANIALGAALQIRDARLPQPAVLMLLYGAYLGGISTESWRNFGDGRFGLAAATMALFWNAYAGANPPRADPRITPARANLQGLPRSLLMNAELDILRDDSVLLARMLRSAGVDVEELGYPGAVHGFTQYVKTCALARRALTEAGAVLARAVAGSS